MGIVCTIPEAGLDYVMYGDKSHIVSDYLLKQMQSLQNIASPIVNRIFNAVQSSYNYVSDSLVKTGIMQSLRQQGILAVDDYFQELHTIEQLQQASPTMQRWVMAHPEVRQLYINQNIDGYSDTYQNVFGKEVGDQDYNYRMVMSGVVEDTDTEMKYSLYYDQLHPGDRELTMDEKHTIMSTWDAMSLILATSNIDFTHQTDKQAKINRE